MSSINFKKVVPYLVAVVTFLILSVFFFKPVAFDNKQLKQHDLNTFRGAYQEVNTYSAKDHEVIFWTNSMFSGMPTYLIGTGGDNGNKVRTIGGVFSLFMANPFGLLIISMLGFYLLLLTFRINPWLSLAGGIAYAFSSMTIIFIVAGHETKVIAIGLMPFIFAGINLVYNNKKFIGTTLIALAMSVQLAANHFQITYYMVMIMGIWLLGVFIQAIRTKALRSFVIASAFVALGFILGFSSGITGFLVNKEYGDYSTRGNTELTVGKNAEDVGHAGLDRDYAFQYSMDVPDVFTVLVPNIVGGNEFYWGGLYSSAGPNYFGIIIFLFYLIGCFNVKGWIRYVLNGAILLGILLSLGSYFPSFNYIMFDHFPYYNKFRAVSTAFVIVQFCMPLLGFLGIKQLIEDVNEKSLDIKKSFFYPAGILLAILLLLVASPSISVNTEKMGELIKQANNLPASQVLPAEQYDQLEEFGTKLVRADAGRNLVFVVLMCIALFAFIKKKLPANGLFIAVILLITVDLLWVDSRYFDSKRNTETKKKSKTEYFAKSAADADILAENAEDHARVLNMRDPFNDANTSYYHSSIGGYSGAKMKRYQELIENRIRPEMMSLSTQDSTGGDPFDKTQVLNMLNCKYFITDPSQRAFRNPKAYGHAWYVKNIVWAENADDEMTLLGKTTDLRNNVLIDKRYKQVIGELTPSADSTSSVKQIEYHPNHLKYTSNNSNEGFVVFSEIWYEKDWVCYIDGKKTDYVRCNYVLRGLKVPAGSHTIEFKIEANTYKTGEKIAMASSYSIFLLIAITIGMIVKKKELV